MGRGGLEPPTYGLRVGFFPIFSLIFSLFLQFLIDKNLKRSFIEFFELPRWD
jgi:hypothetical protein